MKVKNKDQANYNLTNGISAIDKQIIELIGSKSTINDVNEIFTEKREHIDGGPKNIINFNVYRNQNSITSTDRSNEDEIQNRYDDTKENETEEEDKSIENMINIKTADSRMETTPSRMEFANSKNEFKDQYYKIFVKRKRFSKEYVRVIHNDHIVKYLPNIKKIRRYEFRNIDIYFQNYAFLKDEILKCLESHKKEILETVFQNYNYEKNEEEDK